MTTHSFNNVKVWHADAGINMTLQGIEDSKRAKFTFSFSPKNPFVGTIVLKTDDPYEIDARWTPGFEPLTERDYRSPLLAEKSQALRYGDEAVPIYWNGELQGWAVGIRNANWHGVRLYLENELCPFCGAPIGGEHTPGCPRSQAGQTMYTAEQHEEDLYELWKRNEEDAQEGGQKAGGEADDAEACHAQAGDAGAGLQPSQDAVPAVQELSQTASFLLRMADGFDRAPRSGADNDSPEGGRYVQISDTLMKQLSGQLRDFARALSS